MLVYSPMYARTSQLFVSVVCLSNILITQEDIMLKFSTFLRALGSIRGALIWSIVLFVVGIGTGWVSTGPLEDILLNQIGGLREISERLEQGNNVQ